MEISKAKKLALSKMKEHGLIKKGWEFRYDYAKTRLGVCKISKLEKVIGLSKYWVKGLDEAEVLDTILHEIAHALTPGEGHKQAWKDMCIKIGAKPNRLADVVKPVKEVKQLEYNYKKEKKYRKPKVEYIFECTGCGVSSVRHRIKQSSTYSCGLCGSKANVTKFKAGTKKIIK
jgi:predicted SprT family Zn-dependent metalloprotease